MQARQNELLYHQTSTALLASAVAAAAIVFVYLHLTPLSILFGWVSALFIVLGIRALQLVRFFRTPDRRHHPERWYAGFIVTTALAGGIWGSTGFILVPATAGEPQLILYTAMALLFSCALAAGSLATYSVRIDSYLAFALPCLLPMGIGFLFNDHEFIRTIGLLALLYTMFLIMFSMRISRTMTDTLHREVENTRLLQELKQERDKAHALANHMQTLSSQDSLTGIANRRQLDEFLEREWGRAIRFGEPLSLILGDIDFFKPYNDIYGHQAGDKCLKRIAQLLHQFSRRAGDLAARYGGEEFAIILANTDAQAAARQAESLRAHIEALQLPHSASRVAPHITMSFGVATIVPRQHDELKTFIKSADQLLYRAKTQGRNRIASAEPVSLGSQEADPIEVQQWDEGPLESHSLLREFAKRGYRCLIQNYQPHTPIGQHAHCNDEINLVLNGEIAISFQEQNLRLRPGDYIRVPSRRIHEAAVIGEQPLSLLIAVRQDAEETTRQQT